MNLSGTNAYVQIGIQCAILCCQQRSGILYAGMVVLGCREGIDNLAVGVVGSAGLYGERDCS